MMCAVEEPGSVSRGDRKYVQGPFYLCGDIDNTPELFIKVDFVRKTC